MEFSIPKFLILHEVGKTLASLFRFFLEVPVLRKHWLAVFGSPEKYQDFINLCERFADYYLPKPRGGTRDPRGGESIQDVYDDLKTFNIFAYGKEYEGFSKFSYDTKKSFGDRMFVYSLITLYFCEPTNEAIITEVYNVDNDVIEWQNKDYQEFKEFFENLKSELLK